MRNSGLLPDFEETVTNNKLASAVYFALAYVDAAFRGVVPSHLLSRWCPGDPLFVHRYGDLKGQEAVWPDRSLLARLFDHTGAERKEGHPLF